MEDVVVNHGVHGAGGVEHADQDNGGQAWKKCWGLNGLLGSRNLSHEQEL